MENEFYIPISQLIAAPMVAMVEGETIAAKATKEFIETVGFKNSSSLNANDLGELAMVTFKYFKSNADFTQVEETVSVPILSLFPIPLLQIKNAEIEFGLDLTSKITFLPWFSFRIALASSNVRSSPYQTLSFVRRRTLSASPSKAKSKSRFSDLIKFLKDAIL